MKQHQENIFENKLFHMKYIGKYLNIVERLDP